MAPASSSYVTVALRQGHGPHLLNVMGWYEDDFVCAEGEWRIRRRTIRDWSGPILGGYCRAERRARSTTASSGACGQTRSGLVDQVRDRDWDWD